MCLPPGRHSLLRILLWLAPALVLRQDLPRLVPDLLEPDLPGTLVLERSGLQQLHLQLLHGVPQGRVRLLAERRHFGQLALKVAVQIVNDDCCSHVISARLGFCVRFHRREGAVALELG